MYMGAETAQLKKNMNKNVTKETLIVKCEKNGFVSRCIPIE